MMETCTANIWAERRNWLESEYDRAEDLHTNHRALLEKALRENAPNAIIDHHIGAEQAYGTMMDWIIDEIEYAENEAKVLEDDVVQRARETRE